MNRWLYLLWIWVIWVGGMSFASAQAPAPTDPGADTPALTETMAFDSGATIAYAPDWGVSGDSQRVMLSTNTFRLIVSDYPAYQIRGFTISSPPETVLEEAFYEVIFDIKIAFDPAALQPFTEEDRTIVLYFENLSGAYAYIWAFVPFSNGQFGVVRMEGYVDLALLLSVVRTFDNTQSAESTPPPNGGRADLAREMIDLENGPLDLRFLAEDVEFSFGYPDEWTIEPRPTGEVSASFENTRVIFYGQTFLQANGLAGLSTPEELVEDAAQRFGDYQLGESIIFKAEGRYAVQYDAISPAGDPVIFVGVTFSDARLGLALIEGADISLLESVVYSMLDSFDIAPLQVAPLTQTFVSADLSFTLNYPEGWSATPVPEGAYVAISDGQIAVNVYGPTGITAQGIVPQDVVSLSEAVIALIGWEAEPTVRLRVDERPVARLIYTNPIFETQGRLYAILLDNTTGMYGYFDVVPLNDAASVALYEAVVLEMLATFHAVSGEGA